MFVKAKVKDFVKPGQDQILTDQNADRPDRPELLTDQNCWCLTSGNSLPVNLNQAQVQKSISFLPTPVAHRLPHQPMCVGGVLTAAPEMEGLRERRPQMHKNGMEDREKKTEGQAPEASQEQSLAPN